MDTIEYSAGGRMLQSVVVEPHQNEADPSQPEKRPVLKRNNSRTQLSKQDSSKQEDPSYASKQNEVLKNNSFLEEAENEDNIQFQSSIKMHSLLDIS